MVYDDIPHTRFQGSASAGSRGKPGQVGSSKKSGPGSRGGKPKAPPKAGGRTPAHPKKTAPPASQPHPTSHTTKSGANHVPTGDTIQILGETAAPVPHHKGAALGSGGALHGQQLVHHPQASGKLAAHGATHHGLAKRARIISYDSATNTAIVQYGDTPDSPTVRIPVSAAITAAEIGSASMAGISLWDDTDPTDAMISTVL